MMEDFTSEKGSMNGFLSDNFYFSLKQGQEIFEECEKRLNRETVDLSVNIVNSLWFEYHGVVVEPACFVLFWF